MTKNLYKRGELFTARLVIPTKYRPLLGRSTLAQSTGTGDLREAERRSHRILADLHDRMLSMVKDATSDVGRDPRSLLDHAANLKADVDAGTLDYETAAELLSGLLEGLREKRGEPLDSSAEPSEAATYRSAFGTLSGDVSILLGRAIDAYEAHQSTRGVRASTVKAQARACRLFLEFAGEMPADRVTKKLAAQWVSERVMTLDAAPKTKSELIAALVGFFNYLDRAGHLADGIRNPFSGLKEHIRATKRATGDEKKTPRPWTADELAKLAALPDDDTFRSVGLLALYSGARTDEVCSLKVADVDLTAKSFRITAGKSAAAVRALPLHSAIVPTVARMVARAEEAGRDFLFDLKPTGADQKRAPALRAYRRLDRLFGEKRDELLTFYGLRHTLATALERAGVDATLRGRILGHTPGDLGSAVYSAGADLQQMRAAIERVSFETFTG